MCMIGAEKHHDWKDLVKFLRKSFGLNKPVEDEKKDDESNELPLKAVSKKRNSPFAFLEFTDEE